MAIWTREIDSRLVELRESGLQFTEIAKTLGTTYHAAKARYRRIARPETNRRRLHTVTRRNHVESAQEQLTCSGLRLAPGHYAVDQRSYEILRVARK